VTSEQVVAMSRAELDALVGYRLPGGTYSIDAARHAGLLEAVGGEPDPGGAAIAIEAFFAVNSGMGIDLDELFALAGATADDGPMLGEIAIEVAVPLRIGTTYEVNGTIVATDRKHGQRAGVFDTVVAQFELTVDGERHAVVTNTYVFPRG
jgi:hypothetical protein